MSQLEWCGSFFSGSEIGVPLFKCHLITTTFKCSHLNRWGGLGKRLLIPVEKKRCWPRRRWWNCLLLSNREEDSISTQGPAGLATRQSVRRFYSRWANLLCRFCVLWGRCQIWLWALVHRCSALASSFAWGWASYVQFSAFCYTQEFFKTGRSFVNINSSPLIAGMVWVWLACCGYCASKDAPLWLVAAWFRSSLSVFHGVVLKIVVAAAASLCESSWCWSCHLGFVRTLLIPPREVK